MSGPSDLRAIKSECSLPLSPREASNTNPLSPKSKLSSTLPFSIKPEESTPANVERQKKIDSLRRNGIGQRNLADSLRSLKDHFSLYNNTSPSAPILPSTRSAYELPSIKSISIPTFFIFHPSVDPLSARYKKAIPLPPPEEFYKWLITDSPNSFTTSSQESFRDTQINSSSNDELIKLDSTKRQETEKGKEEAISEETSQVVVLSHKSLIHRIDAIGIDFCRKRIDALDRIKCLTIHESNKMEENHASVVLEELQKSDSLLIPLFPFLTNTNYTDRKAEFVQDLKETFGSHNSHNLVKTFAKRLNSLFQRDQSILKEIFHLESIEEMQTLIECLYKWSNHYYLNYLKGYSECYFSIEWINPQTHHIIEKIPPITILRSFLFAKNQKRAISLCINEKISLIKEDLETKEHYLKELIHALVERNIRPLDTFEANFQIKFFVDSMVTSLKRNEFNFYVPFLRLFTDNYLGGIEYELRIKLFPSLFAPFWTEENRTLPHQILMPLNKINPMKSLFRVAHFLSYTTYSRTDPFTKDETRPLVHWIFKSIGSYDPVENIYSRSFQIAKMEMTEFITSEEQKAILEALRNVKTGS